MIVTQTGTVCYDVDYYPWGAEQKVYTNTCPVQNYKFTGKERDPDMGEDYFGARFYKGDMSRFFSPDWSASPEPVPYSKLGDPQTLNLYSYVANNPVSLRDMDGHDFYGEPAAAAGVREDGIFTWARDIVAAQDKSEREALQAQNTCKYDACVTAQPPKKSFWGRVGGWFSGAVFGVVRWGKLGGPLHRAGVERVSRFLAKSGFKVQTEVRIPTRNGAKSSRWVDVVGTRNGEVRMYQIGKQNLDGTPVAREVQALDDIEGATGVRPNFLPYNVGDPNFGVPGATDIAPGEGIAPGKGEVPVEPEIIPE